MKYGQVAMIKPNVDQLLIFTRYPVAGETKTRLTPALGFEEAARVQKALTELTLRKIEPLVNTGHIQARVLYAGSSESSMRGWLGPSVVLEEQAKGDLGQKMSRAFDNAFGKNGAARVIIIGTDIYDLGADIVAEAFESLDRHDMVLGPAADGGYYLIGLNDPRPELFIDIDWGTSRALEMTLDRAKSGNMRVHLLRTLRDIDRPEDLEILDEAFLRSVLGGL